jgi:hypothetical protein
MIKKSVGAYLMTLAQLSPEGAENNPLGLVSNVVPSARKTEEV